MGENNNLDNDDSKNMTFGNLLSSFRKKLGLTQKDFGELIMVTRVTACMMEKNFDIDELSDELLFKLNYLSSKISKSANFDDDVKNDSIKIFNITSMLIQERVTNYIDRPVLKLFVKNIF